MYVIINNNKHDRYCTKKYLVIILWLGRRMLLSLFFIPSINMYYYYLQIRI